MGTVHTARSSRSGLWVPVHEGEHGARRVWLGSEDLEHDLRHDLDRMLPRGHESAGIWYADPYASDRL